MATSVLFDLAPERARVRVYSHELRAQNGPVPCWSYVTDGLRASGHDEIVFTLVRGAGAGLEHAPHEPLDLLRTIAHLAAQGRRVEGGGFTEFGPQGLLGATQLRGLTYQTALPMDDVDLPAGCLTAVALVGHEIDTVKRFGALRILARLGRASRHYPTARWCDPSRAPVSPPETGTILNGVASAAFAGVSAVLEGARVVVRIPRALIPKFARGLPPPEAALALLTVLDPRADACLVWFPGQLAPEAISLPQSQGQRISGCFALFVPQQSADSVGTFEDGFATMLTNASWALVRQSLARGEPLELPGGVGPQARSLTLEWFDSAPSG